MTRRIDARPNRLGSPDTTDPEKIEELQQRVDKHTRLTAKKTGAVFSDVLKKRMKKLRGEDEDEDEDGAEEEEQQQGGKEALLALHPGQQASLANKKKVIVKG
jgi:predicted KAP-like P-loop ATPase